MNESHEKPKDYDDLYRQHITQSLSHRERLERQNRLHWASCPEAFEFIESVVYPGWRALLPKFLPSDPPPKPLSTAENSALNHAAVEWLTEHGLFHVYRGHFFVLLPTGLTAFFMDHLPIVEFDSDFVLRYFQLGWQHEGQSFLKRLFQ